MPAEDPKIVSVDPQHPAPEAIGRAAEVIRAGGTVVVPTRDLYGLAADATDPGAVSKVFAIKRRPATAPLLILIGKAQDVEGLAVSVSPQARLLMRHIWPGRLTIVLEAVPDLPGELTAHTGKIGIRLPGHPVAAALARAAGVPITGTSANLSGQGGFSRVAAMDEAIRQGVDLILDGGELRGGSGSTVVDMSAGSMHILRVGSISEAKLRSLLRSG
jgi:L-threonylcarbamoyladenylate synthase